MSREFVLITKQKYEELERLKLEKLSCSENDLGLKDLTKDEQNCQVDGISAHNIKPDAETQTEQYGEGETEFNKPFVKMSYDTFDSIHTKKIHKKKYTKNRQKWLTFKF